MSYVNDKEAAMALHQKAQALQNEIKKVIIGQDDTIQKLLISIFANGHSLLIGLPGLAKTLLVKTISEVLDLNFNRIQFTPDLMPGDITGAEILDENRNFRFIRGPLFANIVLADEINRTPPKTQAALLEAMQEKSVTVGGQAHHLEKPFFVLATQNPIEQEGTYPLPEAQLDRFMFNLNLTYPSYKDELEIIKNTTGADIKTVQKIMSAADIVFFQDLVKRVPVADNVFEYAVKLVAKTRPQSEFAGKLIKEYVSYGAGPRAGQFLIVGAKSNALLNGKFSPDIDDVKYVAEAVLQHRIIRNFKAEAEGISVQDLIKSIL
jgi:MoxR-like ATPase